MTGRPRLSVVIPTRDRPDFLRSCLEGFAGQSADRETFEVVVVDDGSASPLDDVIADAGRGMDLRVEHRPGDGVSAARNVGIMLARGDLLILFDDDQRPAPDLVSHCLAFHERAPEEEDFLLLRLVPDLAGPRAPESFAMFEGGVFVAYPAQGERWGLGAFWGGATNRLRSCWSVSLVLLDQIRLQVPMWKHHDEHPI